MWKSSHLLLDALGNEDGMHRNEFLLEVFQKSFSEMREHYETTFFILKQESKNFENVEWIIYTFCFCFENYSSIFVEGCCPV